MVDQFSLIRIKVEKSGSKIISCPFYSLQNLDRTVCLWWPRWNCRSKCDNCIAAGPILCRWIMAFGRRVPIRCHQHRFSNHLGRPVNRNLNRRVPVSLHCTACWHSSSQLHLCWLECKTTRCSFHRRTLLMIAHLVHDHRHTCNHHTNVNSLRASHFAEHNLVRKTLLC